MTIQDALRQLEDAGCFRRAAGGDQHAASYFVRAAAFLSNPNGDPNGWGWLSKSGGEGGVDGDDGKRYSEDALVLGNNPGSLSNVYDFVGGTGAPGARVQYAAGPSPRRESNKWTAPHALSARESEYIGLPVAGGGGGGGNGGGGGGGTPTPTTTCQFQPANLTGLVAEVQALRAELAQARADIATIEGYAQGAAQDAKAAALAIFDVKAWLEAGLVVRLSNRILGAVTGTVGKP